MSRPAPLREQIQVSLIYEPGRLPPILAKNDERHCERAEQDRRPRPPSQMEDCNDAADEKANSEITKHFREPLETTSVHARAGILALNLGLSPLVRTFARGQPVSCRVLPHMFSWSSPPERRYFA